MKVIVVFWLLSFALYAQQPTKNAAGCGVVNARAWQEYEAYEYQKSIVSLLQPGDRALTSVSVFETGNTPKYFLRMKAPNVFELMRATSTEALPVTIERLRSAGEFPVSPREAIKLVDFKWESKVLSPAEFERIYSGFSDALSRYASNVAKRPVQSGDRITVDAPEFSIGYTSAGFENFEITAMPSRDQSGNLDDPIAKWALGFIDDARRRFDAGSNRQIGAREAAVVRTFLQSYVARTSSKEEAKETTYSAAFVDLNDDGKREAIVYLTGSPWCGTGGCTMMILAPVAKSYRIVSTVTVARLPILVLQTKSHGWHDIVVGGRISGDKPLFEAILSFNGQRYPGNPTIPPARRAAEQLRGEVVFSENLNETPLFP